MHKSFTILGVDCLQDKTSGMCQDGAQTVLFTCCAVLTKTNYWLVPSLCELVLYHQMDYIGE